MKKRDYIFIAFAAVVCIVSVLINISKEKSGDSVEVYVDSKLTEVLPLDKNTVKDINGGTNRIVIENGEVYMEYADCPDKLCVSMGRISDTGKDIVCLPNKVIVRVTKKGDIDATTK